ncbi:hypothetical protein OIU85_027690 [Salix viminalis]|uniref:Uncharacterized protein n=1 Tax=Salix viminalis TaxID=40686 RepID=A0A9Q0TAH2_SALVM|nr:hypothetical protein OIU85_027690 [Salix viminalis]
MNAEICLDKCWINAAALISAREIVGAIAGSSVLIDAGGIVGMIVVVFLDFCWSNFWDDQTLKKDIRIENSTQFFMKFLGKMLFMIEVIRDNPESETTESDDKNQDLTRVSAYGKMTLARIASALDEEHGKFL